MKRTAIALSAILCLLAALSAQSTETSDFCHIAWKKDCASAMKQFGLHAAKRDTHRMINIAAMYGQGWGILPDDTASFGWHQRAAQASDADAMTLLAEDYTKGHGVPIVDFELTNLTRFLREQTGSTQCARNSRGSLTPTGICPSISGRAKDGDAVATY